MQLYVDATHCCDCTVGRPGSNSNKTKMRKSRAKSSRTAVRTRRGRGTCFWRPRCFSSCPFGVLCFKYWSHCWFPPSPRCASSWGPLASLERSPAALNCVVARKRSGTLWRCAHLPCLSDLGRCGHYCGMLLHVTGNANAVLLVTCSYYTQWPVFSIPFVTS
jgi:hypothetical protein